MNDRRCSVTSGYGEVLVHDDVGKWLTRGVRCQYPEQVCICYARATHDAVRACIKRLRLQNRMASGCEIIRDQRS